MKKFSILLAALVLIFSSCDELKDLADVEFDAEFNADIPVTNMAVSKSASLDDTSIPFGGSYLLELESDEEVAKYIDLLEGIVLTGYTMKPIGLTGEQMLNAITIKVNEVVMFSATDVVGTSEYTEADVDQAAIDEFTNSLLQNKKATISVEGTSNMTVNIVISQLFKTTITANPL